MRCGKVQIKGKDLVRIDKCCKCGRRSFYFVISFSSEKYVRINYSISFYCKDCYNKLRR